MTTIALHDHSLLALAAYGQFTTKGPINVERLKVLNEDIHGFAHVQAADFVERFQVAVATYNDNIGPSPSNFDATIFREARNGELTISIRGTQQKSGPGNDLLADLQILQSGAAAHQIVSMYNWIRRISAAPGVLVPQFKLEEVGILELLSGSNLIYSFGAGSLRLSGPHLVPATGELVQPGVLSSDPDGKITVSGSSLGGHLSIAAGALFPSLVSRAYAFNSPAFRDNSGNNRLFQALGGVRPQGAVQPENNPSSNITSVVSSEVALGLPRFDRIPGVGGYPGHGVLVPIENQGIVDVPDPKSLSWNHDQRQVTDSLAVHKLLSKLDRSLTLSQFDHVLRAAASGENRSLENIIDSLEFYFGIDRTPMLAGNEYRDLLYEAMEDLESHGAFTAWAGKLTLSSPRSTIASTDARSDLRIMIQLDGLTPLQLAPTIGLEGAFAAALASFHPALYAKWNRDRSLTASQRANGEESFSDRWIADRSAMLEAITLRNPGNLLTVGPEQNARFTKRVNYKDAGTGESIATGTGSLSPLDVQFGASGADLMSSVERQAVLYGGAGADTIKGTVGADWLEGNDDADLLVGNGGADTLSGGFGNDTLKADGNDALVGGKGDDVLEASGASNTLNGGSDFDRYVLGAESRWASIDDSDGAGRIEIATRGLLSGDGALKRAPNAWRSADNLVSFTLVPNGATSADLKIDYGPNSIVLVRNWRNGSLGITLGDVAPPPVTISSFTGDFIKKLDVADASKYVFDNYNYVSAGFAPGAMDLIHGANVSSHVSGGGGNDGLAGMVASDLIDGGDGDDLLLGNLGADTLIGGAGRDFIAGSAGGGLELPLSPNTPAIVAPGPEITRGLRWVTYDSGRDEQVFSSALLGASATTLANDEGNLIDAGIGNDTILAGSGSDIAYGGAGHDEIQGLGGSDVLEGDDGNDTISGDGLDQSGYANSVPGTLHGADLISGGGGNDSLTGQGGSDWIYGGIGDDKLSGDEHDKRFTPWEFHGGDYLDGGDGSDELIGDGGSDTLLGGEGDDSLFGDASTSKLAGSHHGDDRLEGGAGDDYLEGGGRADTLFGGADNDMLWGDAALDTLQAGEAGADWLEGGDGRDTLVGGGFADTLYGGAGDDHLTGDGAGASVDQHDADMLHGGSGSDTLIGDGGSDGLYGGEGDDLLIGGDGNDLLEGGDGTDLLKGGAGDDVYLIGASPLNSLGGAETIDDDEGSNSIVFEQIASSAVQVAAMPTGDLQFISPSGDALLMIGGARNAGNVFHFADGLRFETSSLIQDLSLTSVMLVDSNGHEQAIGGRNADLLTANNANATLSGGRGNDRLNGSRGSNTYHYRLGDGSDTVADTSVARGLVDPAQRNRIVFGNAISAGDLRLSNTSGAGGFRIQVGPDSNDSITLGEFDATSGAPTPIDGFRFADGTELSFAQLLSLGFEGSIGNDTVAGTALDDRLSGSFGNDLLVGGAGSDTYRWAPGDDADTISEALDSGTDTLEIGGSVSADDLMLLRLGDDLIVRLREDAQQQVVVTGQFAGERIERLSFSDGTIWSHATIVSKLASALTAGDDIYSGTTGPDQIHAGDGNDHVNGLPGDDLIDGGAGRDTLSGHNGNDTLLGDLDEDRLSGDMGNDRLEGGPGNDTLIGWEGNDTLIAGTGDDYLSADDGDDLLIDGRFLSGGRGSDTFQLTTWRSATISEATNDPGAVDRLFLPIASSSVRLDFHASEYAGEPDDLLIKASIFDPQTVTVERFFESPNFTTSIESFTFSDGVTWTAADIHAMMPVNRLSDADDLIINGFAWSDFIDAKGGNDQVSGRGGDDHISGGEGDDTLYGNQGSDTLLGGTGADLLYGDPSFTTDEAGNDRLEGGAGSDTLEGAGGNDTLIGGSGDDRLLGGTGDDSYLLDLSSGFDRIEDSAGLDTLVLGTGIGSNRIGLFADGKDLVVTIDQTAVQARIVNHSGGSAIEQIRFADGSTWDASTIKARVTGGVANAMVGTSANNSFVVDHGDDSISEGLNQGIDSVSSSVSYVLPTNVENLTLTGFVNLVGTGNALDNLIVGNAGNNHLDGLTGYDTLRGGAGDDVYLIDPLRDTVIELSGQGLDTVLSEWDYVLPDNIENLSHAPRWFRSISLTGNSMANVISVPDAGISRSTLNGAGGADTMIAYGIGTIFYVDDPGDVLIGTPGHVVSALDWTLGAGWQDLVLTGAADHGVGNAGANELVGSSNPDRLEGLDGNDTFRAALGFWSKQSTFYYDSWGPDTLVGGRGNDRYDIDWSDAAHDTVIELPGEGIDTVEIRGTTRVYDLAEFPNVENLVLSGGGRSGLRGNAAANELSGNAESNWIDGGAGDDILVDQPYSTWSRHDADTLLGGDGDDKLSSRGGYDLIDGGPGDDLISLGSESNSTVVFGRGSAADLVHAIPLYSFTERRVVMGDGIRAADLTLARDARTLAIGLRSSPTDSLTWLGFYADESTSALAGSLTAIDFTDGFSLSAEQLALRQARAAPNVATSSDDVLLGGAGSDLLSGLAGDDLIDGSDGADDLRGGPGNDTLYGGHGDDTYRYERGDGVDLLVDGRGDADMLILGNGIAPADVTVSFTDQLELDIYDALTLQLSSGADALIVGKEGELPAIDSVRFADGTVWSAAMLVDKATRINGTAGADSIVGTDSNDRIFGLAGNDTLRGGYGDDEIDGGPGSDQMRGEHGNDTYLVDSTGDVVIEEAGRGFDSISSSVSFTLGSNVESLQLTGSAPINATGSSAADWIGGNSANNLIDGAGGADTMAGGAGNDSYKVDNLLDSIVEMINEGVDLVTSTVHHTLAPQVENLTLSGTSPLNGYGNDLANLLTGNGANNRLEGGAGDDTLDGGAGNDAMFGGAGNDRYLVGSTGDIVSESSGQGVDTVVTGLAWTLSDHVENLSLTGSSKVRGTGNALDNWLVGNTGGNELIGLAGRDTLDGGAGSDTLRGGAGDDVFHVDVTGDSVIENANEGTDEVIAPLSWTLGNNLEHLTLTGTSALKATGNALANRLSGNSGANVLTGLAGSDTLDGAGGNDTLVGGAGADTYMFRRGSGADLVQENETTAGVRDIVLLQGTLTRADLRFTRLSNDLEMAVVGSADKMVFQNWYLGSAYHAEEFRFSDGSMLTDNEAQALVGAMATFGATASAADSLTVQPRMTIGTVDYTSNVAL